MTTRPTTLRFLMPMPFDDRWELTLSNDSDQELRNAEIHIFRESAAAGLMRLYARTWSARPRYGEVLTLARLRGSGVLAGLNLHTAAPPELQPRFFNQEGNEYLIVDGEPAAGWKGTGTEDYFNCGYYYQGGEVSRPLGVLGIITQ